MIGGEQTPDGIWWSYRNPSNSGIFICGKRFVYNYSHPIHGSPLYL